ncbi:MAG: DUF6152 family protein [Candidatus Acidoferrales bacterium]|nr:DUF6152 family protein [Candidatus Acidoferrales bacterium]
MKRMRFKFSAATFILLAISIPAFAHHGTSRYDLDKTVTLNGTVTGFDWGNPHCLVHMDVKSSSGEVQHWTLELASPFTMSKVGWSKDSIMLGDMLTADTHPARNGLTIGISSTSRSVMKFVVNGKPLATQ